MDPYTHAPSASQAATCAAAEPAAVASARETLLLWAGMGSPPRC
ncbi:hypothetical protein ACFIQG_20330 [Comamonas odontotermitis]